SGCTPSPSNDLPISRKTLNHLRQRVLSYVNRFGQLIELALNLRRFLIELVHQNFRAAEDTGFARLLEFTRQFGGDGRAHLRKRTFQGVSRTRDARSVAFIDASAHVAEQTRSLFSQNSTEL